MTRRSLIVVAGLLVIATFVRGELANTARLPKHGLKVLGDDRYAFYARYVFYTDDEHVAAIGEKEAARIVVQTGRRAEFQTEVGLFLGPDYLRRGGDRWTFGTRWQGEGSIVTIVDVTGRKSAFDLEFKGKRQALAIHDKGKFLLLLNTKHDDLSIDVVNTKTGKTIHQLEGPKHHSGNSQDNPQAWFVGKGRAIAVAHRQQGSRALNLRFFEFGKDGRVGKLISQTKLGEKQLSWRVLPARDKQQMFFIGHHGGELHLHNFVTNETTLVARMERYHVTGAALSRKKYLVALCTNVGTIQIHDLKSKTMLREIEVIDRAINDLDISPDGSTLVAATSQGRIRFWDLESGEEHRTSNSTLGAPMSLAASADFGKVAVADAIGQSEVWDVLTGARTPLQDDPIGSFGGYDTWVGPQFLAFTPDGKRVIGGGNKRHNALNVWDAATGNRLKKIPGHKYPIMSVACSSDGQWYASTSRDSTLRVFDEDGEQLHAFDDASASLAFVPERDQIIACHAHGKGNGLRLFDLASGKLQREYHAPNEKRSPWAYAVAASPKGKRMASIHRDGMLRIWKMNRTEPNVEVPIREPGIRSRHTFGSVAFSPNGKLLAASCGTKWISICDAKTGNILTQLHGHSKEVRSFAFNADSDRLVSAAPDFRVIIWDIGSALASKD